jgi:hypothetical protein
MLDLQSFTLGFAGGLLAWNAGIAELEKFLKAALAQPASGGE